MSLFLWCATRPTSPNHTHLPQIVRSFVHLSIVTRNRLAFPINFIKIQFVFLLVYSAHKTMTILHGGHMTTHRIYPQPILFWLTRFIFIWFNVMDLQRPALYICTSRLCTFFYFFLLNRLCLCAKWCSTLVNYKWI